MRICVIGAGVTGLTVAKALSDRHQVEIYEKESAIGGIAKVKSVNGVAYHMVGGHCMNSKNSDILDFIFNEVLEKDQWHHVQRKATVNFENNSVPYPIEFNIKEIAKINKELAFDITKDFLTTTYEEGKVKNLADWFRGKFGETLANKYFIPYNQKIWLQDLDKMSFEWVQDKLPIPDKQSFFDALVGDKDDKMPHSTFYYPNSNTQNTFINGLAEGLNINLNKKVFSVENSGQKWKVNKNSIYDIIINTMPLDVLPFIVGGVPDKVKAAASKLKYNKVTNMLWKTTEVDSTWTYIPEDGNIFHRHIHIGNFFNPVKNYTITESMGERTYDEMLQQGKRYDYLLEPLDYNVSEHAYVVYDENYKDSTACIKSYFEEIGLHTIGRFGEWEYYNMDVCMESALKLAKKINSMYDNEV